MTERPQPARVRIEADGRPPVALVPTSVRSADETLPPGLMMRLSRLPDHAETLDYLEFTDTAARARFLDDADPAITSYDVVDVVTPKGCSAVEVEPGHFIQLITMITGTGRLSTALQVNAEATRQFFRGRNGFVGVVMHTGPADPNEPDRLLEIVVWQSESHYRAATSDPGFRKHVEEDQGLTSRIDVGRYDLV